MHAMTRICAMGQVCVVIFLALHDILDWGLPPVYEMTVVPSDIWFVCKQAKAYIMFVLKNTVGNAQVCVMFANLSPSTKRYAQDFLTRHRHTQIHTHTHTHTHKISTSAHFFNNMDSCIWLSRTWHAGCFDNTRKNIHAQKGMESVWPGGGVLRWSLRIPHPKRSPSPPRRRGPLAAHLLQPAPWYVCIFDDGRNFPLLVL